MKKLSRVGHLAKRVRWRLTPLRSGSDELSGKPRLFVDLSVIAQRDAQTGIQRVVRAIWSELRKASGPFDLVPVCATSERGYCAVALDVLDGNRTFTQLAPIVPRQGDHFLGLDLSAQFLPTYQSQLRSWRASGVKIHVVMYDLLPVIRPASFHRRTVSRFRAWFKFVSRHADQVICISRQVGRDLREGLSQIRPDAVPNIAYLQLGGDIAASSPSSGMCDEIASLLNRMRFRPTILMVGTLEPRKGYDVAVAAFEHLWRTNSRNAPDVVIVGKPGWKTEALQRHIRTHEEHGRRLHWLSAVSDEGLCRLYDSCRGLLMCSHAEGFGLPLLEAVTHRRHVLTRDLPVFREQELPNVSYFEDDRPTSLGQAIIELSARGQDRPADMPLLPTWSESVAQLLSHLGLSDASPDVNREAVARAG